MIGAGPISISDQLCDWRWSHYGRRGGILQYKILPGGRFKFIFSLVFVCPYTVMFQQFLQCDAWRVESGVGGRVVAPVGLGVAFVNVLLTVT